MFRDIFKNIFSVSSVYSSVQVVTGNGEVLCYLSFRDLRYFNKKYKLLRRLRKLLDCSISSFKKVSNQIIVFYNPDRIRVLRRVSNSGLALQFASKKLQNDKEVILTAVSNNGYALQFASISLRGNKEVVIAAVSSDGRALQFAISELRDDKEVVLAAISNNINSLCHAGEEFQDKF
jgi:hypothetical protein